MLTLLKKIPIDFGQANLKYTTKGKQIALSLIPKRMEGVALDVGCRDGHFSHILESRGYMTISIDIEKNYEKCKIINANDALPFEENTFDVIWCSEVIEHLVNPQKSIEEFRRVLKPEGIAIFTTPNSEFWLYCVLKLFGLTPKDVQNPTHLHFFGIRDIQKFSPEKIYGYFPYVLVKFRITRFINPLSPTFVFVVKK